MKTGIDGPKERATFSIAASLKGQLERMVPKSRRSNFVEAAIAEAFARKPYCNPAERIAKSTLASHGHPQLEDSIYHAMAVERGGIFVTADQRHFTKAKRFGNIVLLADWRPADRPIQQRP